MTDPEITSELLTAPLVRKGKRKVTPADTARIRGKIAECASLLEEWAEVVDLDPQNVELLQHGTKEEIRTHLRGLEDGMAAMILSRKADCLGLDETINAWAEYLAKERTRQKKAKHNYTRRPKKNKQNKQVDVPETIVEEDEAKERALHTRDGQSLQRTDAVEQSLAVAPASDAS